MAYCKQVVVVFSVEGEQAADCAELSTMNLPAGLSNFEDTVQICIGIPMDISGLACLFCCWLLLPACELSGAC